MQPKDLAAVMERQANITTPPPPPAGAWFACRSHPSIRSHSPILWIRLFLAGGIGSGRGPRGGGLNRQGLGGEEQQPLESSRAN